MDGASWAEEVRLLGPSVDGADAAADSCRRHRHRCRRRRCRRRRCCRCRCRRRRRRRRHCRCHCRRHCSRYQRGHTMHSRQTRGRHRSHPHCVRHAHSRSTRPPSSRRASLASALSQPKLRCEIKCKHSNPVRWVHTEVDLPGTCQKTNQLTNLWKRDISQPILSRPWPHQASSPSPSWRRRAAAVLRWRRRGVVGRWAPGTRPSDATTLPRPRIASWACRC